jgi:DNA-binding response OmpR family regulator
MGLDHIALTGLFDRKRILGARASVVRLKCRTADTIAAVGLQGWQCISVESSGAQPLVLIVDEVPPLIKLLKLELGFQGMVLDTVLLEDDPLAKAIEMKPDVVVVGAVIPTPVLYDLIAHLKANVSTKVLFINGTGNDGDAALALQEGADDTITRPFLPDVLGMHIRSLLAIDPPEATMLRRGPLTIDFLRRIVWNGERKLAVGTNEWGLLLALARSTRVMQARELLTTVWGDEYAEELQFLVVWMNRLRVNIGDDPLHPAIVLGTPEEGYRLAG